jgi:hypothetical protein
LNWTFLGITSLHGQTKVPIFENLGKNINTNYSEINPTISLDGKTLFYVIQGHPQNFKSTINPASQDIWTSNLDQTGNWSVAQPTELPIHLDEYNSLFYCSPDSKKMLIRGTYEKSKLIGRGISLLNKYDTGWSEPQKLFIEDFEKLNLGIFGGASLSSDGKIMLLFFSEQLNSEVNDIYVSFSKGSNNWSKPKNIGTTINQEDTDEISPYLANDNQTLYFSSNREGSIGDNDIWLSRRLDDTWENWSTPENLGDSINTKYWDAYFKLDNSDQLGYFSTYFNAIGGADLVKVKVPKMLRQSV